MFGLMKGAPRLPYCGSCKTIGALYGQRARLLLNHDLVFLAELLMEQTGEPEWSKAHRSFNCLAMPDQQPPALAYAASVAVVLAHFQVEDQIADSKGRHMRVIQRFFSPVYRKAAADLRAAGFPFDKMTALLGTQRAREARAASLEDVAEPTARATEMVFAHGWPGLAWIGRRFGFLVYVLDAWEDRTKDAKSGDFNALLRFPSVDGRAQILSTLESLEKDLPPRLAVRLRTNVEEKLGVRPRVMYVRTCRSSARQRWQTAVAFASSMKEKERAGFAKGMVVIATVAVLAFLAPHQIRSAESWRQCFGLTLNLMAIGAVFATAQGPDAPGGPVKPKNSSFACGDCCCESCDCCECCGSCCECL